MSHPTPAPARTWLAPLLAAALAACQGSDPQPFQPLSLDRFAGPDSLLAGGGGSSTFGYTSAASLSFPTLRLVRQDAASPDQLVTLGDVTFSAGDLLTRLHVTDEAAALVVSGAARVMDLTAPSALVEAYPLADPALDVAVAGRWVAVATAQGLSLVNRDDPATTYPQPTAGAPTALLATRTGFLAFTASGYVVADVRASPPTFSAVSDPVLRDLRDAHADGDVAMAAGPGSAADRSRVVRLDLTDPSMPAVVRSHEVPGSYVTFAWDGGATSVVAIHGAGDDADPTTFHQGYLVLESAGAFQDRGVPLPFWSRGRQVLAARAGRLLAVEAVGAAYLGIR